MHRLRSGYYLDETEIISMLGSAATGEKSLRAIGREFGVVHASVRYHLKKADKLTKHRRARKQFLEDQPTKPEEKTDEVVDSKKIAHVFRLIKEKADENPKYGWALYQTVRYVSLRREKIGNIPLDRVTNMLLDYVYCLDAGTKMSLKELARRSKIGSAAMAGTILEKLDLEPLYGSQERHITPPEKKGAIKRAYEKTDAPLIDIAYFLKLKPHIVYNNVREWYHPEKRERALHIETFSGYSEPLHLTYGDASIIYELMDEDPEADQLAICSLFATRTVTPNIQDMVTYAIKYRKYIEPEIIDLLDVLYPDVKHDKGYL